MKELGIRQLAAAECAGMEADPKYKEILRLDHMLDKAGIYHELVRNWNGWCIIYYGHGDNHVSDAIEHRGSYGQEEDKLEIMGLASDGLDVEGWLTAEDVFVRWNKHWIETADSEQ